MNSLRYIAILVLVLILASLSSWWLSELRKHPEAPVAEDDSHYDYFLKNFTTTVLNEQGQAAYRLKAAYMEHYPLNNRAVLTKPHFTLLEANTTWTVEAQNGVAFVDRQTLDLKGDVILRQMAKNAATLVMTMDKLHIDVGKKTLETTSIVKMSSGKDTIVATGLKANLATGQLELLSRVKGQYHVPSR